MKTIPNYSNTDIRVRDIYIHQASKVADDGDYTIWKYTNHGKHYLIVTMDDNIHAYGIFQETIITHGVWLLEALRVFLDMDATKLKTLVLSHISVKMLQSTPNGYVDTDIWDGIIESVFGSSVRIHDRKTMNVYTKDLFLQYVDSKLPLNTDLRYAYVASSDPTVDKHNRISSCNTPPLYHVIVWDSEPYQHNFGTHFWKEYINIDLTNYDDQMIKLAATYPIRLGTEYCISSQTHEKMYFMFFDKADFTIFRGYVVCKRVRNDTVLMYDSGHSVDTNLTVQSMLTEVAKQYKLQIHHHEFNHTQAFDMFGDRVKLYDAKNNQYVDFDDIIAISDYYWVVNVSCDIPKSDEWYSRYVHKTMTTYYFINDLYRANTL